MRDYSEIEMKVIRVRFFGARIRVGNRKDFEVKR